MTSHKSHDVLYLVTCAAPPCRSIVQLIDLLQADEWEVHVIATPTAASWMQLADIEAKIERPVLYKKRHPDEQSRLPKPQAVAVVPATFNTINAWASGINDTLALGILNEALSLEASVYASVYAKTSLLSHPAFKKNLLLLREAGVFFTEVGALGPSEPGDRFRWEPVVDLIRGGSPT